jgi:hypothetical protein
MLEKDGRLYHGGRYRLGSSPAPRLYGGKDPSERRPFDDR